MDDLALTSFRDIAAECESKTAYAWAVAPILRNASTWLNKAADRQEALEQLRDKYASLNAESVPREWVLNDLAGVLK